MDDGGGGTAAFGKTICSVCYEDLKPIAEDLQVISTCGHVFHELCVQQWFEYCSGKKKNNCPVCKQLCAAKDVTRLYFQSIGDAEDAILSRKPSDCEDDSETMRRERKRLEGKISSLSSALEQHQNELKHLSAELYICKETAKTEASLKNDALKQNASIQQLLRLKSEELEKSTLESSRLQDRNISLAKELAALKLISDLSLEEEDVLKLASFGNEGNKDTIDVLRRSLVVRNRSYTELMAKCNLLGRGEARSLHKLEKSKEKIKKLKTRVQELEAAIEMKDNENLRALKASKKATHTIEGTSDSYPADKKLLENKMGNPVTPVVDLDQIESLVDGPFGHRKTGNSKHVKDIRSNKADNQLSTSALGGNNVPYVLLDDDGVEPTPALHELDMRHQANEDVAIGKSSVSKLEMTSVICKEDSVQEPNSLDVSLRVETSDKDMFNSRGERVEPMLIVDELTHDRPLPRVRKETPSVSLVQSQSGDRCYFSGGLLGPDGTTRYLGKWCKRAQNKGPITPSMSKLPGASTSELISVGADGRGGKIKVLRSLDQSSMESSESPAWAKRCKYGPKTGSSHSKGSLQMEHFFGRASQ